MIRKIFLALLLCLGVAATAQAQPSHTDALIIGKMIEMSSTYDTENDSLWVKISQLESKMGELKGAQDKMRADLKKLAEQRTSDSAAVWVFLASLRVDALAGDSTTNAVFMAEWRAFRVQCAVDSAAVWKHLIALDARQTTSQRWINAWMMAWGKRAGMTEQGVWAAIKNPLNTSGLYAAKMQALSDADGERSWARFVQANSVVTTAGSQDP